MKRPVGLLLVLLTICLALGLPSQGENFAGKDLTHRDFSDKVLNGTDFSSSTLDYANFRRAICKNANFTNASLNGIAFDVTDLAGSTFTGVTGNLQFAESNLTNANLEGVTFTCMARNVFRNANLKKSVVWGILLDCDFRGADLRGANLRHAKVSQGSAGQRFQGAIYDDNTAFPVGFDVEGSGAVKK